MGRRLRHSYEYCLEINAQLRALPWPPREEPKSAGDGDAEMVEAGVPGSQDNQEGESARIDEKGEADRDTAMDQVDHHLAVDDGEFPDDPGHNYAAATAHLAESHETVDDYSHTMDLSMVPTPPRSDHEDAFAETLPRHGQAIDFTCELTDGLSVLKQDIPKRNGDI